MGASRAVSLKTECRALLKLDPKSPEARAMVKRLEHTYRAPISELVERSGARLPDPPDPSLLGGAI